MKKKLIFGIANLSIILLMIVFMVVIFGKDAYGWLKSNRRVRANNMGVVAKANGGDVMVAIGKINSDGSVTFGDYTQLDDAISFIDKIDLPGSCFVFKLKIINTNIDDLELKSIGFASPTAEEEVPIAVNSVNYYFGTQLYVEALSVKINNVPTAYSSGHIYLYDPDESDNSALFFNRNVTLSYGESVEIEAKLTFENKDEDQSVYKNFGRTDKGSTGACLRRIVMNFAK